MPLHAQIACFGGNAIFALIFALAGFQGAGRGETGMAVFMFALAGAAGYSLWVLLKFRKYLSAEDSLEREVEMERMREELDVLKANNEPDGSIH